jgi:hypothetical protein
VFPSQYFPFLFVYLSTIQFLATRLLPHYKLIYNSNFRIYICKLLTQQFVPQTFCCLTSQSVMPSFLRIGNILWSILLLNPFSLFHHPMPFISSQVHTSMYFLCSNYTSVYCTEPTSFLSHTCFHFPSLNIYTPLLTSFHTLLLFFPPLLQISPIEVKMFYIHFSQEKEMHS